MDLSPVGRQLVPGSCQHGELAPKSSTDRAAAGVWRPGRVGQAEWHPDGARRTRPRARGAAATRDGGPDTRPGAGATGSDLSGFRRVGRRQSARRHGPRASGPRIPQRAPPPSSYPDALRTRAGVVARRRAAARPSPVGGGALGRGHADLGQSSAAEDMPGLELRLDLPGHHQERYAAVVRHAGVWQPGQGPELLRPPPGFAETAQDIGRGACAAAPRRSTASATRVGRRMIPSLRTFTAGESRSTL